MPKKIKLNQEVQTDRNGCLFLSRPVTEFKDVDYVEKLLRWVTNFDGDLHISNSGDCIDIKYSDTLRRGVVHLLQIQWKSRIELRLVFAPGFGTGHEVGTEYLESLHNDFFW